MDIPILFENDEVVAVNKPYGLLVHADGRSDRPTLADWFVSAYPGSKDVGEPETLGNGVTVERPGVVHRLDADTSGVVLLAKTPEVFVHLKRQFHDRKIKKVYEAFVYGSVRNERGIINRPIGKSKKDPRIRTAMRGVRGMVREAITHYRVLARLPGDEAGDTGVTHLELRPKTGRTHQLRVHMKAINHPIIADPLYAPGKQHLLGFERLALHARSIAFELPNEEIVRVEAPFPEDFERARALIGGAA